MCNRQRRGALRFPNFVENACCNPCCDNAVQAVVSAASDTAQNCCCGCCCCGCCNCGCGDCGGCGNVGGANTGCGNCGNVGGRNTGCRRGVAGANSGFCDVSGIWDLPSRPYRPEPFCPCDPFPFPPPVFEPTPELR